MNSKSDSFVKWIVVILCILPISGCLPATALDITQTDISQEVTEIPTSTQQPTIEEILEPTITSTSTPLPTLTNSEAAEVASEYFENNGDCVLPCWWGITPGDTTWEDAEQFFLFFNKDIFFSYAEDNSIFTAYPSISLPADFSEYPPEHGFLVEEGMITWISAWPRSLSTFTLSRILSENVMPTEIKINTGSEGPADTISLGLVLFYADQGIWASIGMETTVNNSYVIGCPPTDQLLTSRHLELWSPQQIMSFEEVFNQWHFVTAGESNEFYLDMYIPIEDITNMDIETFYQIYSDPEADQCIYTPRDQWPMIWP